MNLPLESRGITYCTRCVMPSTKPGISFDSYGVCNACRYTETMYDRDADKAAAELVALADEAKQTAAERGAKFDVLVPVSGGKDSTYICYTMKDLGLRVLGCFVRPLRITARGQANLDNLTRMFPVFTYSIDDDANGIRRKLRDSFVEKGLPLQPYDDLIYGVPEHLAADLKIPLVMRGEASERFYGNKPETAQQYADVESAGTKCRYLSDYTVWDSQVTAKFAIDRGLSIRHKSELRDTGGYWLHEQLDDKFPIVSHWLKYLKYGYGRATDHACRDLRAGRCPSDRSVIVPLAEPRDNPRLAAMEMVREYDGHIGADYIAAYCDYVGMSVPEFIHHARKWDAFEDLRPQ